MLWQSRGPPALAAVTGPRVARAFLRMLQSPPSVTPHYSVRSLSCFYAIKLNITNITVKLPNINSGHDGTRGFALFTIAF